MKRKIGLAAGILLSLFLLYFLGSGFMKEGSAIIGEYRVSPDGRAITFHVGVASSTGYVRQVAVHQQEGGKLYLDCYCAFGGFNGSIGSKSEYTIPLNADTEIIAIYRNTNCYEDVLKKDSDGNWQRVQ